MIMYVCINTQEMKKVEIIFPRPGDLRLMFAEQQLLYITVHTGHFGWNIEMWLNMGYIRSWYSALSMSYL